MVDKYGELTLDKTFMEQSMPHFKSWLINCDDFKDCRGVLAPYKKSDDCPWKNSDQISNNKVLKYNS